MYNSRAQTLFLLLLLHSVLLAPLVSAQGSKWSTLSGNPPKVIANGGFSGIFPSSTSYAYNLALLVSVPDVVLWCDVQLTKDGVGICAPDLLLSNSSDIADIFKKRNKAYLVNGVPTKGWFSVDFTFKELSTIALIQGVYSRTNKFDGNAFPILTVKDVASTYKPRGFWLNVQHDQFFTQHNLSMRSFVISVSKTVIVNYISSPEVAFLKSIMARLNPKTTKLVFRFLGQDETEPSTNQTYGSLLKNLTFVKTFASGIMVPKSYIWPVDANNYLLPYMSVVLDAHKEGLEVFASDFSNDVPFSFNYSYDPVTEFLNYVDNGIFSVDGVLTDFPITPSEAIGCFAHLGQNASAQAKALVISKYGASGDYPGCTDLAYKKAIDDHVDILDCPVQLAKDGTPFCLSSINLIDSTTVAQSMFSNLTRSIPAIKSGSGIFTFSLTWSQIQSLTPSIANPYAGYRLFRNPKYKNAGRYLTLADFLTLSKKASSLTGVLISIENAAYLAGEQGLDVIQAVKDALSKASYDNQVALRVMIQSTNSSVLQQFKDKTNYELVYKVDENIRDAANSAVGDIKKFAHAVVVGKTSVFPENNAFLTGVTDTVSKLKSFKLPVYVETFSNEFVSQAWDFFSDATVEINSYVTGASVDGVITDYPKTAARYKRNPCLLGKNAPPYMSSVEAGSLMQLITPDYLPPAEAPFPVLNESDVMEPPMPPVSATATTPTSSPGGVNTTIAPTQRNGQSKIASCFFLPYLAMLLSALFLV
uniref:glycerophosphodiester phosphodiesterase n=2 Tax=Quercus lobata TaxID=97700 RepID=A0A7N2M9N3_QUELO